jgi:hypothetical protein
MGLADVLFGRRKLKEPSREKLFALATAGVTLEAELGLKAVAGAVVFKPLSASQFVRVENDLQELLEKLASETETKLERRTDRYDYEWLVFRDADLSDLVTTAHAVGSELAATGFGPQLLAAVFRFDGGKLPVHWIYGYKRGTELKAKLERELPVEPDISRWFALFDAPL